MKTNQRHILFILISVLFVAACTAGSYSLTMNRLTVVNPNQNVLGDKPYIAVIRFQSTFSVAGSTVVQPNVELTQLGRRMKSGDSAAIPASIGYKNYPIVARFSREEVVDEGKNPTVYGTIVVALEEDIVGGGTVSDSILDTASVLEESLERHVAQGSWSLGLGFGQALQNVSADLISDQDGGGCGLFDTRACSWFRDRIGDDLVGRAFYAAVNIDAAYFAELSDLFEVFGGGEWPGCNHTSNPICYVRSESRTLDLTGEGNGHYRVSMTSDFDTGS